MTTTLIVLHVMVCVVLIVVVLLQRGKGSDVGAALGGGGGNTVFGSRGAGNFLTKLTTASAIIFMLTSLTLAYLGNKATNPIDFGDDILETTTDAEAEAAAPGGNLEEIEVETAPVTNTLEEIPQPQAAEPAAESPATDPPATE